MQPTFPIGTKVVETSVVGRWEAVVKEIRPIDKPLVPSSDGFCYLTVGRSPTINPASVPLLVSCILLIFLLSNFLSLAL